MRVGDGGLDLRAVAHDSGVCHQPVDVAFGVAGDAVDVEPVERATEVLPLTQDDQPRQATLERLEADPLEEGGGVPQRLAPLGVVIVAIENEISRGQTCFVDPTAPDVVVGCHGHEPSFSEGSACTPPPTGSSALSMPWAARTAASWPRSRSSS